MSRRGTPVGDAARASLLAQARRARPPGDSLRRAAGLHPADAHRRQGDALAALLASLAPGDWDAPTSAGVSVQGLVAHLVAQQRWVARSLFGVGHFEPPAGAEHDHWGLSRPTIERLLARPPWVAAGELADAVDLVVGVAAATPPERFAAGGTVTLDDLLAARTFELWIHADDIRAATGRPWLDPRADELDRLCRLAVTLTPIGMALAGVRHDGRVLRLVLTGDGGGTFVVPLGAPPARPARAPGREDVTVVVDGLRFCRVAGRLLDPDALAAHVEGDAALVADVVAGARWFAA